jgi:CheY-like chemotaxis protein
MKTTVNSILLIDDDEATNFLNQIIINQCNCFKSIQFTYNAQDALDFLTARGEYSKYKGIALPDIILLDINLPGMDGWEFLDNYGRLNLCGLNNIIVTILTVSPKADNLGKINEYDYLNDYLEKPLTFEKLNQIIRY